MQDITIRNASLADAPRILEIYAWYVEHTVITFEYDVPSLEEFEGRMRRTMQKYPYSSCGGNNGSAFAGFNANTVFLNVSLGLVMLFARFLPIIGTLAIAGSLAGKKKIATTAGTMSTTNGMFVFLLIVVVLLIGALSFFPALALGPLAEFFGSIA